MSRRPEYMIWAAMLNRCYNPKNEVFENYGGRGITVCDEWKTSFLNFFSDVGPRPDPKFVIDRINNDRGYEPGNVQWTTRTISNNNRRTVRFIEHNGVSELATVVAQRSGINVNRLCARLQAGWSIEKALHTPIREHACPAS